MTLSCFFLHLYVISSVHTYKQHAMKEVNQVLAFDQSGQPVNFPSFLIEEPVFEVRIHTNEFANELTYKDEHPVFDSIFSRYADRGFQYCYQVRGKAISVKDLTDKFFAFAENCAQEAHELSRLEEMSHAGYAENHAV